MEAELETSGRMTVDIPQDRVSRVELRFRIDGRALTLDNRAVADSEGAGGASPDLEAAAGSAGDVEIHNWLRPARASG